MLKKDPILKEIPFRNGFSNIFLTPSCFPLILFHHLFMSPSKHEEEEHRVQRRRHKVYHSRLLNLSTDTEKSALARDGTFTATPEEHVTQS